MRAKPLKKGIPGDSNRSAIEQVLTLARKCNYERQHTHQVEKLAMLIFDQLVELHHMGDKERFLLRCGALLHDIGWLEGQKGHHKTALRIIMEDATLPFDSRDKCIIALVARYHRRALPVKSHPYYSELGAKDRIIVRKLAGILRIADGLDWSHRNLVQNIDCSPDVSRLLMTCSSSELLDEEFKAATEKADLFKDVFDKKLVLRRKNP